MKKVLIGVAALAVIIVGGLAFVWSNLDGIVKDAIQTYGSEATKTEVRVGDVKLELEAGKAAISGLTVGNPSGFTDPNIFSLGNIATKIDVSTIRQNPIVIDEIIISAAAVIYEINKAGTSNVDVLKQNLAGGSAKAKPAADKAGGGEELKMIIRKLVVEGSQAKVRIAALGDAEQTVKLPSILLTDVGKKSGGATAAEVAQILSSKLVGNVKGAVTSLGVNKYLGKSADLLKKGAMDQVGKVGGSAGTAVTDSLGGAAGGAGNAVKGLFGK
ncbi:MAG: hypothetical protein Q9M17_06690 [Mariprofundus sp.]|nr:hypothetical protein [Mariprofundus sp.]